MVWERGAWLVEWLEYDLMVGVPGWIISFDGLARILVSGFLLVGGWIGKGVPSFLLLMTDLHGYQRLLGLGMSQLERPEMPTESLSSYHIRLSFLMLQEIATISVTPGASASCLPD